jgi:EmrB/QacA subfamily drug resistance transporter
VLGVGWFALASIACAAAPTVGWLIAARVLQGVGAALLTPGSLAIIESCFVPEDRASAIGAWSGLTGIAAALGPFFGGVLVDTWGWRFVFALPVPLAIAAMWAAGAHVPESRRPEPVSLDLGGAGLAILGLGGVTYAVIAAPEGGWTAPTLWAAGMGAVATICFVAWERRSGEPMLPLAIFRSRQFRSANLVTFTVYGALGGVFFLLVVHLQIVVGYGATQAGAATIPIMVLLLAGSPSAGRIAQRYGPRLPLTVGPVLLAAGMLMMGSIPPAATYLTDILPSLVVFGVGLTLTVTPVTAAVLAAIGDEHAGLASGINNAAARTAQLLAIAALPAAAGLSGGAFTNPTAFSSGFAEAMAIAAALSSLGAAIAWIGVREPLTGAPADAVLDRLHCSTQAPPPVTDTE